MHYIASAIIISIIYLVAFLVIDECMYCTIGIRSSQMDMTKQCIFEFMTVFIITVILSITSIDAVLCAAH